MCHIGLLLNVLGCFCSHSKQSSVLLNIIHSVVPRSIFLGDTGVPLPEF